jgi:hypothetical protein
MALRISLKYGRGPGWFRSLSREDQAAVLASERLQSKRSEGSASPAKLPPSIQSALDKRRDQMSGKK